MLVLERLVFRHSLTTSISDYIVHTLFAVLNAAKTEGEVAAVYTSKSYRNLILAVPRR